MREKSVSFRRLDGEAELKEEAGNVNSPDAQVPRKTDEEIDLENRCDYCFAKIVPPENPRQHCTWYTPTPSCLFSGRWYIRNRVAKNRLCLPITSIMNDFRISLTQLTAEKLAGKNQVPRPAVEVGLSDGRKGERGRIYSARKVVRV